jgi:hypothetical protein
MRRRSRPSPLGVFASVTVVIALTAAAPVTASTSARPWDRSRANYLYGGQFNYLADVNDNDNRLLAASGADFRGTFPQIADPRYVSSILVKHIKPPVRCRVPAVKNKPLAVAVLAIVKRHCSLGKIGRAFSTVVKRDHVISEMPRARTVLPNQGKVNLVISRGRRP